MRSSVCRLTKISLDLGGQQAVWIDCPPGSVPDPGRFCMLTAPGDQEAVLPVVVFAAEVSETGFMAVGALPVYWLPGISLHIRGPLGKGFNMPAGLSRLALGVVGESPSRLMPLALLAAGQGADVAWFTDTSLQDMPAAYELNPFNDLPESLRWADFVALDLPLEKLPALRDILDFGGEPFEDRLPFLGQVLVNTDMPCGGAGDCGACAVPIRRGWKLVCQDGPVFDILDLIR